MDWTPYNNTTPWGLLTDEQKAEMKAHEGRFEIWNHVDGWREINFSPCWQYKIVYRAVRKPVEETHTRRLRCLFDPSDANDWPGMVREKDFIDNPLGTATVTTSDGKPVKLVWEADEC